MLQATWFWHIGFVLYPPVQGVRLLTWNRCDHNNVSLTTVAFCWHAMVILTFLLVQQLLVKRMYRTRATAWDELIYIDEVNAVARVIRGNNGTASGGEARFLFMNSEESRDEEDENSLDENVEFDATRMQKIAVSSTNNHK
jgi:hypothetical protein